MKRAVAIAASRKIIADDDDDGDDDDGERAYQSSDSSLEAKEGMAASSAPVGDTQLSSIGTSE